MHQSNLAATRVETRPARVTSAVNVAVAVAPAASPPNEHVPTQASTRQAAASARASGVALGGRSSSTTPGAASGPRFVTVTWYVTLSPTTGSAGEAAIATPTSAAHVPQMPRPDR